MGWVGLDWIELRRNRSDSMAPLSMAGLAFLYVFVRVRVDPWSFCGVAHITYFMSQVILCFVLCIRLWCWRRWWWLLAVAFNCEHITEQLPVITLIRLIDLSVIWSFVYCCVSILGVWEARRGGRGGQNAKARV